MALAAAAAVPDLISGVIAIDGFLPIVPGWDPPLVRLEGLPILLIDAIETPDQLDGLLAGDELATTFRLWGAVVERSIAPAGVVPEDAMSQWMATQSIRRHSEVAIDE